MSSSRYVDVDSALFRARVGWPPHSPPILARDRAAWTCELPGATRVPGAYAERKSALRYARKLERELGDRLRCRLPEREHLDRVLEDLERVAASSYRGGLGVGFDAARDRELVALDMERGWFEAWILYVDSVPRAFEMGTTYGAVFPRRERLPTRWARSGWGTTSPCAPGAICARTPPCASSTSGTARGLQARGGDGPPARADLMIHARSPRACDQGDALVGHGRGPPRTPARRRTASPASSAVADLRTPGA